jgi:putative transposase
MALENLKQHLELKGSGEKSSPDKVLDVLLAAATNNSSIEQECSSLEGAPSPNTVRGVLRESLKLQNLERQVNQALWAHLNTRYWKGPQKVAVDLVEVPYHGLAAKDSDEIRRGQAKQGTTHFHVFATAYVVRQHRRVTLALHYVRQEESLVSVLDALKSWLSELGIQVGLWLADRAFCSVSALRWFSQQPEAIVPMVARGKKAPLSGSRVLFASTQSYWDRYTMHSETDGTLTFDVAVVRRYSKPSRRGKQVPPTTLVYAVVGKRLQPQRTKRSFYSMVETYRSRFGIESSYRQMNQARLRTCSRSPELRLLAVAIAFVLRNLWALCRWMTILTICWQALSETAKLLNTIKASEMKDTASKLEIPKYRNMNKTQLLLEIVEAHEALPAFSE